MKVVGEPWQNKLEITVHAYAQNHYATCFVVKISYVFIYKINITLLSLLFPNLKEKGDFPSRAAKIRNVLNNQLKILKKVYYISLPKPSAEVSPIYANTQCDRLLMATLRWYDDNVNDNIYSYYYHYRCSKDSSKVTIQPMAFVKNLICYKISFVIVFVFVFVDSTKVQCQKSDVNNKILRCKSL